MRLHTCLSRGYTLLKYNKFVYAPGFLCPAHLTESLLQCSRTEHAYPVVRIPDICGSQASAFTAAVWSWNFQSDESPGSSSVPSSPAQMFRLHYNYSWTNPVKSQMQTLLSCPPLARLAVIGPPSPLHFNPHFLSMTSTSCLTDVTVRSLDPEARTCVPCQCTDSLDVCLLISAVERKCCGVVYVKSPGKCSNSEGCPFLYPGNGGDSVIEGSKITKLRYSCVMGCP